MDLGSCTAPPPPDTLQPLMLGEGRPSWGWAGQVMHSKEGTLSGHGVAVPWPSSVKPQKNPRAFHCT